MKELVFGDGRIAYRYLPKTASTSIKAAIYQLETGELFNQKDVGMSVHAYMSQNRKKGRVVHCEKRFVVVRDPIERFLSAYKNRVCFHGEVSESFVKERFPGQYWQIPYFTPGVGQFIDHLEDYLKVTPVFHHCRSIVDFFGQRPLEFYTHIYKIQNLDQLATDLSEWTGKEVAFERRQTGGKNYFLRDLSKAQLQKLIKFYRHDYELLQGLYSVDDVWRKWRGDEHGPDVPRPSVMGKAMTYLKKSTTGKLKSSR